MFRETQAYFAETGLSIEGAIHIGAHLAEELEFYTKSGAKKALWIEANNDIFDKLVSRLSKDSYIRSTVAKACLSDKDGETVTFHITNHAQSSSILPLKTHKEHYPDVVEVGTRKMKTETFKTFLSKTEMSLDGYDFLCLDVQGAELKVLKGFSELLSSFKIVCVEVNEEQLYEGNALLHEVDDFFKSNGFERTFLFMTEAKWGEAVYVKSR